MFKKATKHEAKLRMAIAGPSGAGKTYTALTLATELANGKPIALVDTEHGSASKYADLFEFDVMEMSPPYHPDRYGEAIKDAAAAGYGVLILDSLTHAWKGEGGMLELVTEIAKRKYGGNSYAAWNDATPVQKRLIESIISAPIHIIATMRSKMDYVQEKDERGKSVIRKVGMAPEQRDDMPYEFDVMLDMNIDNEAIVTKTRCPALTGKVIAKPGKQVADILNQWLQGAPAPQVTTNGHANGNGVLLEQLHKLGGELYGDQWTQVCRHNAERISNGVTVDANALNTEQVQKLINGLQSLKRKRQAPDNALEQEAA